MERKIVELLRYLVIIGWVHVAIFGITSFYSIASVEMAKHEMRQFSTVSDKLRKDMERAQSALLDQLTNGQHVTPPRPTVRRER